MTENTLHDYLKARFGGVDIDYQTGLAAERAGLYEASQTDPNAAAMAQFDGFMMSLPSLGPPEAEEFCLDRINTDDYSLVKETIKEFYESQGFRSGESVFRDLFFVKGKTQLSVLTTFQRSRPSIIITVQDRSHYGEPYEE